MDFFPSLCGGHESHKSLHSRAVAHHLFCRLTKDAVFFAAIKAGDFRSPKDAVLFVNKDRERFSASIKDRELRVNKGLRIESDFSRQ